MTEELGVEPGAKVSLAVNVLPGDIRWECARGLEKEELLRDDRKDAAVLRTATKM